MKSKVLAAVVLVSAACLPAIAGAADLYPDYRPRVGSPYDDPRYRGIYGDEAPAPAPRYVERRDLPPPPVTVYPEPRRGYLPPMPPPAYVDQRYWQPERGGNCVPREHIKQGLVQDGWSGFQDLDIRGPFAVLHAYRPDGRLYRLKVDRCSGDLLSTRLVDRREQADAGDYDDAPDAPRGSQYEGRRYRY